MILAILALMARQYINFKIQSVSYAMNLHKTKAVMILKFLLPK